MSQTPAAAQPISPLRRRMIEDMTVRGFGEKTQSDYIRHVKNFTIFLGRSPDKAEGEELRAFQVRQREQGIQPPTMNGAVAALRFFFATTCGRPEMARHLSLVMGKHPKPVTEADFARTQSPTRRPVADHIRCARYSDRARALRFRCQSSLRSRSHHRPRCRGSERCSRSS